MDNPAEKNHVERHTPPQPSREPGAAAEDQERFFPSQEKMAGATDCKEVLKKMEGEEGKKVGEERRQNGIVRSLAKMKVGEYTRIILHGLGVCVKSVMCCGECFCCSDSSRLTVAGELKQLFLKNSLSCLTRYTNSLFKLKRRQCIFKYR